MKNSFRNLDVSRRNFIGGAMLGFAGIAAIDLRSAQAQTSAQPPAADIPPKPVGLKPHAMFDCRFPQSYETAVPAAMSVLTQYFAALAKRDLRAMAKTFHYPFAIYEGTEAIVVESETNLLANPPPSLNVAGTLPPGTQGHGGLTIRKGSYDMLDTLQLHTFNPVNVGLELVFSRYDAHGEKLEVCQGIYGVTNNDGRWAIQLASTIYTPANQMNVEYRDAVEHQLRSGRDWMMGWSYSDGKLLNMRPGSPGKQASIAGGTRGTGENYTPDRFERFDKLASGQVGKYGYTLVLPNQRVLHATVNKAHTFGGYIRYTPESVMISETRSLGIITYNYGQWGSAGGFGQSMYRDRSNDQL